MKLNIPPESKNDIIANEKLAEILRPLIGTEFVLTYKPRTDGSRIRKLISSYIEHYATNADPSTYKIIPPKKKGLPKLLSELIDTYVVTSGDSYNLQVWNRNPNGNNTLVKYINGESIKPKDIRLVMVKISVEENKISSIAILTPSYIEKKFGKFGKPTTKNQLLVSEKIRNSIVESGHPILFLDDTEKVQSLSCPSADLSNVSFSALPTKTTLRPLSVIKEIVATHLIGKTLTAADTKTRGQELERLVIELLGYKSEKNLMGGFPDVPNQLLEIKVQDAQTIDLGRYSPQFVEVIDSNMDLSTEDVRYLIALTNPLNHVIEGVILSCGESLGENFTYVSASSYKCQRAIPMEFFDNLDGQCVFNP